MIKINHHRAYSNTMESSGMPEVKTIKVLSDSSSVREASSEDAKHSTESGNETVSETIQTDAERRTKRKEEFREAALVRDRAIKMQRQAESQIKETQNFYALVQQAKDDPLVLAKALNMSPEEFQRKIFNKTYSIKDEAAPVKEETFEEQTKRKLAEYEQERAQEREYRTEESKKQTEAEFQRTKHSYITDQIMPLINESHEFIHRNDKYSCAALIYDLMNQAYQEAGGKQEEFTLKASDVINELEEQLEKRAEAQILEARNIGKLKKYFQEENSGDVGRKDFRKTHSVPSSTTLSNNLGASLPPSSLSAPSYTSRSTGNKIPLRNREARLAAAQKNLGG